MEAIEGYTVCELCGAPWVLVIVARRTGGLCETCWGDGKSATTIEIIEHGLSIKAPNRKRRRTGSRGQPDTRRRSEHARRRAKTRLSRLVPDLYDQLLAQERAKLGLEPWPIEIALRAGEDPDASKTLAALDGYDPAPTNGARPT